MILELPITDQQLSVKHLTRTLVTHLPTLDECSVIIRMQYCTK